MQGDKELRSQVKLIGSVLGDVLQNHTRETVFEVVEQLRTGYIQLEN